MQANMENSAVATGLENVGFHSRPKSSNYHTIVLISCAGKVMLKILQAKVGGGSGWGTHVHPWLIHVNVWQKLL